MTMYTDYQSGETVYWGAADYWKIGVVIATYGSNAWVREDGFFLPEHYGPHWVVYQGDAIERQPQPITFRKLRREPRTRTAIEGEIKHPHY